MGWLIEPNGDPLMAAEPVFHEQTPGGVERVGISFGHTLSNLPELLKNSTEKSATQGAVQAQPPMRIVVHLARSESAQDTTGFVV